MSVSEEPETVEKPQVEVPEIPHDVEEPAPTSTKTCPTSPKVTPALASRGGREVSTTILYVGGLESTVTDDTLEKLFSPHGDLVKVNILADKNSPGQSFAFVEFGKDEDAQTCYESMTKDKLVIEGKSVVINWAYQSQQSKQNPDSINIFVGDLSTEINDEQLKDCFNEYPSVIQAHVMWDMQTGHSRGYGFVSFADRFEAEDALLKMNGKVIAGRAIRLNWAHKQQRGPNNHHHNNNSNAGNNNQNNNNNNSNNSYNGHTNRYRHGGVPGHHQASSPQTTPFYQQASTPPIISQQTFDAVARKSPTWQTTVYVGNISHFSTQAELFQLVQNFGFVVDFKMYADRGCAFVKYDSHERATLAILQMQGCIVGGRPLKLGWGRERAHHHNNHNHNHQHPHQSNGQMPMNGNVNGYQNFGYGQ